jgi:hypothetical protein
MRRAGRLRLVLAVGWVGVACSSGLAVSTAVAAQCPNEQFRTGRSASLPDCRAYELVTPEELGRTEDILFEASQDFAVASSDGEHVALEAHGSFVEPDASNTGTQAVLSRTSTGWTIQSITAPGMAGNRFELELLSPELSQVAFKSTPALDIFTANRALEVGPVGGPYTTLGSVPHEEAQATHFLAANAGTESVPAFSDVVFYSPDHALLPPGPERELAEKTEPEARNLYQWTGGQLHLLNVDSDGKLLNTCGAQVGGAEAGTAINAVSADGSKVFFVSPEPETPPPCPQPQLYMRVDGRETVEISKPQGLTVAPSGLGRVFYDGASLNGSKVFFTAESALTRDAGEHGSYLYEYDTEALEGQRLTLIANGVEAYDKVNPVVVVSEDGSTVYYERGSDIFRYETATGVRTFVAVISETSSAYEQSYTTPNGESLVFASGKTDAPGVMFAGPRGELLEETRGAGHTELYRYDAAGGSVMCVSCGEGVAPVKGEVVVPNPFSGLLGTVDSPREAVEISENGRRVFFQTSARLMAQDTNESTAAEETSGELGVGSDVYEWEEDGTEEGSGVFCHVANGCTHLISAGEDVGPERLLGASSSGRDVFFTSAAQLVPQADPEFTNIYDARVEGGFPSLSPGAECTSCQGVGSPPPLVGPGASGTFAGAGNPASTSSSSQSSSSKHSEPTTAQKLAKALRVCRKKRKRARASCEKKARRVYGRSK